MFIQALKRRSIRSIVVCSLASLLLVVSASSSKAQPAASSAFLATVNTTVALYNAPNLNANVIGQLTQGQTWFLAGTDTTGSWVQVQVTPSITAWTVRFVFNLSGVTLPVISGVTGGSLSGTTVGGRIVSRGFVYYVRAGDTLGKLALRYGTTISTLARWNKLGNVNLIYVGQRLFIP